MPVSLKENPYESDIPYKEGNIYRAAGEGGYNDFLKTNQVRPADLENKKLKFPSTYYSNDYAVGRYANGNAGKYIVEAVPNEKVVAIPDSRNYSITPKDNHLDGFDKVRWWQRGVDGGYTPVYDNITPWKYGLRNAVRGVGKAAAPIGAALDTADVVNVAADPAASRADVMNEVAGKAGRWVPAAAGAVAGSSFGPVGTVVGGIGGYLLGDVGVRGLRQAVGLDPADPSASAHGLRDLGNRVRGVYAR